MRRLDGEKMKFNSYNELMKCLHEVCRKKKIYIWGASVYGNYLGMLLNKENILWEGYYDNFSVDLNKTYNGKIVKSGKELCECEDSIFVLSMRSYEGVYKQLNDSGVRNEQIVAISNVEVFNQIEESVVDTKKYANKIKKFKGIHKVERCFIIGNGPSLRLEDLERLKKEHTFACNLIFQCYEHTMWRPEYYFFIESNSTTFNTRNNVEYMTNNCKAAFVRGGGSLYSYREDQMINNLYYMKMELPKDIDNMPFSKNCEERVFSGTTITYTMIQMAAYMGFNEIYLIGIDHTFSKIIDKHGKVYSGELDKGKEHAAFLGDYDMPNGSEVYKVESAYRAAQNYCDMNNIKIYNATRGGKLEIFKRIDFDSLFEN